MSTPDRPDLPPFPASEASTPPAAGAPTEPTLAEMQESMDSLRRLFHYSLASLVILLFGLNVYLLNQVRAVRHQAIELSREVGRLNQAVEDYETNNVPWMNKFTAELHRYADTHPDFGPTMARYPKPGAAPKATNSPPNAAPPAAPPSPVKK